MNIINSLPSVGEVLLGEATFLNRKAPTAFASVEMTTETTAQLQLLINLDDYGLYRTWFLPGILRPLSDATCNETDPKEFPNHILVDSPMGRILLLGCRFRNGIGDLRGKRIAQLEAQYTIFSPQDLTHVGKVSALRTELAGLYEWINPSITTAELPLKGSKEFSLHFRLPERIELSADENFSHSIYFNTKKMNADQPTTTVKNYVYLRTLCNGPERWTDALKFTHNMADLLSICANTRIPILSLDSYHSYEEQFPEIIRKWSPVATDILQATPLSKTPRFHFTYDEIGEDGVRKWLQLRQEHERVLEPLLATYGTNNFAEDLLSNASISIEALGYYLFQAQGEDPESNRKRNIGKRAKVVLQYLGSSFEASLAWFPAALAEAYNGMKHANLPRPSAIQTATLADTASAIIRSWIFKELGVREQVIHDKFKSSFEDDRYTLVPDPADLI